MSRAPMRPAPLVPLLLTLVVVASASAQEAPCGAAASDPCPWVVNVDAEGFGADQEWNFTEGDWFHVDLFNFDEVEHTVTFAGHQWTVPALDGVRTAPFAMPAAGDYMIADDPSQDGQTVIILAGEAPPEDGGGSAGMPGPGALLALLALVGMVAARRRAE